MALPAARAPPALGVKTNVAATPALDATRSTADIEKEAKATAPLLVSGNRMFSWVCRSIPLFKVDSLTVSVIVFVSELVNPETEHVTSLVTETEVATVGKLNSSTPVVLIKVADDM